ncbi:MAG: hypothetical protein COZ85_04015 [Candidatus Moranbacteria bacterium CG_4_8_14_3_um_filter_34_16]|nr:MAG: hypothetical protein COT31_04365 [Candidatus Moranbacteria bacterium CG08_land_8_20_14_0_20_34_16]PIW94652.1 MAG: hypothetical protein COZ85_04015 [Candidatus Moranbacteria bacterium CG_4_8_14_3_um_filter_34_16]PJA89308.1 MAG: hypothetical protein CO138_01215 [Candidatus Moranbacteria bacterium CG_4_9_14_3_um_filter_33_15]
MKNQASAILLFVVFLKKTEIEYLCQNDFMKKILWQNQDQNLKEYELCFQKMHIIKTFSLQENNFFSRATNVFRKTPPIHLNLKKIQTYT